MRLRLPVFFLHAVEDIQCRWARKLRAKRFDDVKEALLIKQPPRARVIQHESQFLGSQTNIEGQQHGARLDHAVVGFEEAMTVGAEKRDAVAGLDSRLAQGAGQPAGALGELRVSEPFFSTDHGGALRILLLRVAKETDWRQGYIHGFIEPNSGCLSSVNYEYVSCHIIRGVRSQEDGCSFQIVFAAESSQGNSLEERFFVFFNDHSGHVRREPARCDGVDLNIVGAPLAGQVPGESDYASLTRVVTDGLKLRRRAAKAGHRGDIDDLAAALPHHEPSGSLRK